MEKKLGFWSEISHVRGAKHYTGCVIRYLEWAWVYKSIYIDHIWVYVCLHSIQTRLLYNTPSHDDDDDDELRAVCSKVVKIYHIHA